jgi:HK97 family phage major capsid protein
MDTEQLLAAKRELLHKAQRMGEIVGRAKAENRSLSRRERAEIDTIHAETEALRRRLKPYEFDPRRAQGDISPAHDRERSDVLAPEERVSDWLRDRGRLPAGNQFERWDEGDDGLRFGKLIRGAVTGNWTDAEGERRALGENVLGDGGYLLGPDLSATVIDRVRNQMRVMEAGARTIPLSTEQTYMARLASGTSPVAWHAESGLVNTSDMGFERVVFTAKTLPVIVKISAELFEDLSPEATTTIEDEISLALSLELDRACLRGSGIDPEPQGVLNQPGVTLTSLGANGASPNYWDTAVDAVSVVRNNNIEPDAILWASRTQQTHDKFKTSIGSYTEPPASIAAIPRLVTNQIPTNLTVGGSSDCSEIYVGRFSDLMVGIRTDMRFQVRVLTERYIDNLEYGLLVYLRGDVQLAHPQAFNVVTGVRP